MEVKFKKLSSPGKENIMQTTEFMYCHDLNGAEVEYDAVIPPHRWDNVMLLDGETQSGLSQFLVWMDSSDEDVTEYFLMLGYKGDEFNNL
jgi:hypothetical protein